MDAAAADYDASAVFGRSYPLNTYMRKPKDRKGISLLTGEGREAVEKEKAAAKDAALAKAAEVSRAAARLLPPSLLSPLLSPARQRTRTPFSVNVIVKRHTLAALALNANRVNAVQYLPPASVGGRCAAGASHAG